MRHANEPRALLHASSVERTAHAPCSHVPWYPLNEVVDVLEDVVVVTVVVVMVVVVMVVVVAVVVVPTQVVPTSLKP